MGCRSTPSGRRRARDVVVSPVCAKPYALKRGRSRDAAWWPQATVKCHLYQAYNGSHPQAFIVHHLIAPPIPKRISGRPYHSYRTVRTAPANHPVLRVTLCIIVLLPLFGSSSLLLFLSPSLVFFFCVLLSRVSLIPGHWRRFGSFTLSCYPLFLYLFVQVTLFIPPLR